MGGFSGSDISTAVNDALMEPVRTLQSATHFIKQRAPAGSDLPYIWLPCSPSTRGAIRTTLMQFDDAEQAMVQAPKLSMADFIRVLAKIKPSVSQDDLKRQQDWTVEFGQEGS